MSGITNNHKFVRNMVGLTLIKRKNCKEKNKQTNRSKQLEMTKSFNFKGINLLNLLCMLVYQTYL